jgi:hypothetical protein
MQRQSRRPHESALTVAYLNALRERVAHSDDGRIVLPTGHAAAADVARVLQALDRARREGQR